MPGDAEVSLKLGGRELTRVCGSGAGAQLPFGEAPLRGDPWWLTAPFLGG